MYTSNATAASYNDQLAMQSIMKMPLYTCITLLITNKTDSFQITKEICIVGMPVF